MEHRFLILRYMGSTINSDIAKLEAEIKEEQLKNGIIFDEKAYEKKLLTQEQECLTNELETLRNDTNELMLKLADLQKENNYFEYRRVK